MTPQPLIAVKDVELSSMWYQKLLGCESGHGGREYERLEYEGKLILQLHEWNAQEHQFLQYGASVPRENAVLLWFQTDAYDEAMLRIENLGVEVVEASHINENANHRECWIRDLDGYVVVLASAYGDI